MPAPQNSKSTATTWAIRVALVILCLAGWSTIRGSTQDGSDEQEIRETLTNYVVGWRKGDSELLARIFAVDHGRVMWIAEDSGEEVLRSMTFSEVLERRKARPEYGLSGMSCPST